MALQPIHDLIRTHVLGAERLRADDTTVLLLVKGGMRSARLWTYLRDDRPFAGGALLAAFHHFSIDRRKEHPTRHLAGWTGILQEDAHGGDNERHSAQHKSAPLLSALRWSHSRRYFFEVSEIKTLARKGKKVAEEFRPVAQEAVNRLDAIFETEREIDGLTAAIHHDARQRLVPPMVRKLQSWLRSERARMSKHNPVAKSINSLLEEEGRCEAITRFPDAGWVCLANSAARRALRGLALGRMAWRFAESPAAASEPPSRVP